MRAINSNGRSITLLGDPHLGRRFTTDVPLHRRGDHEALVIQGFIAEMGLEEGFDYHVCMGDLFDKPHVSPDTVLLAANTYLKAAEARPETDFIVLAGNHDLSRDVDCSSSFDLFAAIVNKRHNIIVVRHQPLHMDGMLFVPFTPLMTSHEFVAPYVNEELHVAFGHWDLVSPRTETNTVPKLETLLYVTGHDHHARDEERHGIPLYCTGSMMAYAHGEGEPYRTVTLAELASIPDTKDLCLRVILAQGEELPDGLDALQISVKRYAEAGTEDLTVGFEGFDMSQVFTDTLTEHGVGAELISELFEKYRSRA